MDGMDEIHVRMRITNLEARLALRKIDNNALTREINSPLTSFENRDQALKRLRRTMDEWHQANDDLERLRFVYPDIKH